MKFRILVVLGIVATASFAAGMQPTAQKTVTYAPSTRITANELRYDEGQRTTYARGAVRVVTESSTVTADEADVHLLRSKRAAVDLDIVLRGNVRVLVTPKNGALQ
jgi:lipopolysaccharide assembly outer membrane protein LptD (OstA)